MVVVYIILSIVWFLIKLIYRFFAIFFDFAIAIVLVCLWPLTILFGGLRSKVGGAIGAMFRRVVHHFKALFDKDEYHPLKSDGSWDMRFKVNK